jgi:hypothetical protein
MAFYDSLRTTTCVKHHCDACGSDRDEDVTGTIIICTLADSNLTLQAALTNDEPSQCSRCRSISCRSATTIKAVDSLVIVEFRRGMGFGQRNNVAAPVNLVEH